MTPLVRQFRDFFVSLKLTVVLLALSIVLIFWATLAQVQLGIWGVQEKFFHTFFVLENIPGTAIPVPVFPGGYFLGGLLLLNLVAAHLYRFRFEWKKATCGMPRRRARPCAVHAVWNASPTSTMSGERSSIARRQRRGLSGSR